MDNKSGLVVVNCYNFSEVVQFSFYCSHSDENKKIIQIHDRLQKSTNLLHYENVKIIKDAENHYSIYDLNQSLNQSMPVLKTELSTQTPTAVETDMSERDLETASGPPPRIPNISEPLEKEYLIAHRNERLESINAFLESHNKRRLKRGQELFPIAVSHSIGGVVSQMFSIGVDAALKSSGLYDALSFESGASGGSWATMLMNQSKEDPVLLKEMLIEWQNKVDVQEYERGAFNKLKDEFREYVQSMFTRNLTVEEWEVDNGPIPIIIACQLLHGPITKQDNLEIVEFTPFYTFFEQQEKCWDTKKLTINGEKVTIADIVTASSYLFSAPINKIAKYVFKINYFLNMPLTKPFEIDELKDTDEDKVLGKLDLTDGGVLEFFPMYCLLRRKCRLIIVTNTKKPEHMEDFLDDLKLHIENSKSGSVLKLQDEFFQIESWENKEVIVFKAKTPAEATVIVLQPNFEDETFAGFYSLGLKHEKSEIDYLYEMGYNCCSSQMEMIADIVSELVESEMK